MILLLILFVSFVLFYLKRDACDAVKDRDGYNYDGYTLRVEFPRGSGPGGSGEYSGGGGGGGYHGGGGGRGRDFGGGGGGGGGFGRGRGGGPPSRRSEFRVLVSGNFWPVSLSDPCIP